MGARLGEVLGWLGTAGGLLILVGAVFAAMSDQEHAGAIFGILAGLALLIYLGGRGLRYILAGR